MRGVRVAIDRLGSAVVVFTNSGGRRLPVPVLVSAEFFDDGKARRS